MLVNRIINTQFTPLKPADSVGYALDLMNDLGLDSLPVVEERTGKVIGRVLRRQIADHALAAETISSLELEQAVLLFSEQHIFEAARMLLLHDIQLLPVVDLHMVWQGVVEKRRIQKAFTELLNIQAAGSVVAIELESKDYTLSEIIYLIETEGARILSVAIESPSETGETFRISFKLNVRDTSGISHSLRRHGYSVTFESQSEILQFDMSDRADELMRYLDV